MHFTQIMMYMGFGCLLTLAGYILASMNNDSVAQAGGKTLPDFVAITDIAMISESPSSDVFYRAFLGPPTIAGQREHQHKNAVVTQKRGIALQQMLYDEFSERWPKEYSKYNEGLPKNLEHTIMITDGMTPVDFVNRVSGAYDITPKVLDAVARLVSQNRGRVPSGEYRGSVSLFTQTDIMGSALNKEEPTLMTGKDVTFGTITCCRLQVIDDEGNDSVVLKDNRYGGVVSAYGKDGQQCRFVQQ